VGKGRLVLLDLDGTLLAGPSSEQLFILHLLRNGVLDARRIAAATAFLLRHARRYGLEVWKKDKAYLTGLEVARVAAMAEDLVRGTLLSRIRPRMRARMDAHRAAGDTPALLTGSLEIIARPLARALGIRHVRATRCAVAGGRFAADPPLCHPHDTGKLPPARELAAETGLPLEEAAAYGDSVHDIPLLEAVAHPVAVYPGPGLARTARRRGWEILDGP